LPYATGNVTININIWNCYQNYIFQVWKFEDNDKCWFNFIKIIVMNLILTTY
jgi:hypothetical protein